jgi:hypothetical protein
MFKRSEEDVDEGFPGRCAMDVSLADSTSRGEEGGETLWIS